MVYSFIINRHQFTIYQLQSEELMISKCSLFTTLCNCRVVFPEHHTCQPLTKENLETHEKISGDSTKNRA